MALLEELGTAVASVADKVGASAVRVGGGWRGGSGVVIGPGAVLTNAHNVRSEELTVTFADGRQVSGKLAGIMSMATWQSSRSTPEPAQSSTGRPRLSASARRSSR